jgi:hypothetical protein
MKARGMCRGILAASAIFALLIACATAPKPAQASTETAKPSAAAQAVPATPTKPTAAAPDDIRAQASEVRKKAFDLGVKDALPDDYAAAESAYSAGVAAYGVDNAASGASFADAKAKFGDVIRRGLPMLVSAEKDRAVHARDTAVQKKAGDLFPALLADADADFAKPAASESSGDYETALAGYRASTLDFDVLYKLCDASGARDFLVSHDLAKWDTSNWTLAEGKYASSQSLFRQDAHASSDAVDEAILRYGNVRNTAYGYYAADRKKASETERDRAIGIKSDVAVKDEYDAANAMYAKAESDENAKDHEASSAEYDGAAAAFAAAYTHAKGKMDRAKSELDSLDSAIATAEAAQSR